jgi:hypothetical protein
MLRKLGVLLILVAIMPFFPLASEAQEVERQVVYGFEDSVEGWDLVGDWAGGLAA